MLNFSSRDRLDALELEGLLQVGAAELAVVGGVGQDRDLLEAAARDGLFDDHRRLDAVVRGVAEDVVLGLVVELVRDQRAGGHVVHHRDLGFLEEALRGQRHAGVDVAHHGDDLFLVDQLLGDLHAAFVLGFVVALDQLDLAAEHATGLVDLVGGQAHAVTHAHAHRRGAAGERAVDTDLDRVGRSGSKGGKCQAQRGGKGANGEGSHGVSVGLLGLGARHAASPIRCRSVAIRYRNNFRLNTHCRSAASRTRSPYARFPGALCSLGVSLRSA